MLMIRRGGYHSGRGGGHAVDDFDIGRASRMIGGYQPGATQDMMNSTQPMGGYDSSSPSIQDLVDQELTAAGASPALVRGFHYNINAESGWNPNLRHIDQPKWGGEAHYSHGLLQEGGPEWAGMQAFAAKKGTGWQDPRTQIQYAVQNLKNSGTWDDLNSVKSWQDAAAGLAKNYLRPAAPYLQARLNNIYGIKDFANPAAAAQTYDPKAPVTVQTSGDAQSAPTVDPATLQKLAGLQQDTDLEGVAQGLLKPQQPQVPQQSGFAPPGGPLRLNPQPGAFAQSGLLQKLFQPQFGGAA
jgi:Phage tail lysozyme